MGTLDNQLKYKLQPMVPPWADMTIDIELMSKLLDASRRLSRLDGYVSRLPNRELFINAIVYREANASCIIDGLRKSDRIINNYHELLLSESIKACNGKRLTEETLLKMYTNLRNGLDDNPPRNQNIYARKATFLTQFMNNSHSLPKDPLFRMSLLQYQFEATYPFQNGDGRAGRLVAILYLIQEGLLSQPCLCLSGCYVQHPARYCEAVKSVSVSRNWEQWVEHTLKCICCASDYTMELIRRIQEIQNRIEAAIAENNLKMDRLDLSVLLNIPYISPRQFLSGSIKSVNTAKKYLVQLERLGILTKAKVGKEYVWVNTELMSVLSLPPSPQERCCCQC